MGKVNGFISPTIKGKVGTIVFSRLGTQNLARAYQPIVANPRTPQQLINRGAFGRAVEIAKEVNRLMTKIYGVDNLGSFGAIMKTIRNQGKLKMYRSFRDIKVSNFPECQNLIGQNVKKESVSPLLMENGKKYEEGENVYFLLGFLSQGDTVDLSDDVYFGSDYAFGSLTVIAASCGLFEENTIPLTSVFFDKVDGGIKVTGFRKTADECGNGWNYIYKITAADRKIFLVSKPTASQLNPSVFNNNSLNGEQFVVRTSDTTADAQISFSLFILGTYPAVAGTASKGSMLISSGNINASVGGITY